MADQNDYQRERPVINNYYYGNIGQQINHVDKLEAHFDKNMGIEVDGQNILAGMEAAASAKAGSAANASSSAHAGSADEEWIDEIVPCFMGDKVQALEFVRLARLLKPVDITNLVNAWLVQKKISEMSFKRDLWQPLHDHGIYMRTESCWNSQVHLP